MPAVPAKPRKGAALCAAALLGFVFWPAVRDTARVWLDNDTYAHGVLVPPISAFLLWRLWPRIRAAQRRPSPSGMVLLAAALVVQLVAHWASVPYFGFIALVAAICAVVLSLYGPSVLRVAAFPILFLLVSAPMPGRFTARLSDGLQSASASFAAWLGSAVGLPIMRSGNLLELPGIQLEVAEVCSGFKKTVAFIALGLLYAHLLEMKPGKGALLVASSLPIAVAANVVRIAALAVAASIGGKSAMDSLHNVAEIGVLVLGFLLFSLVAKVLLWQRQPTPQPS